MKPLTLDQLNLLNKLYYEDKLLFGRDRLYKFIVANYPDSKITRRQVMHFLASQETHQLYAPTNKTKDIKRTVLNEPKSQIGIDLVDMSNKEHNGYKYILTCYDLFSKMGYAVALKNKETKTVTNAMKKLIKSKDMKDVKAIRSDNGSEFISDEFKQMLKDNNIHQVLSKPAKPQSNGGIERFNKTMKRYLLMAMKVNKNKDWVSILPTFINNYNNTINRITQKTPNEINDIDDNKILKQTKENILKSSVSKNNNNDQKFNIGDKVRRKLEDDEKTNGQNWSNDVFTVYKVIKPRKNNVSDYVYLIKDNHDEYTNKYYTNDLLKVDQIQNKIKDTEKFTVSKLIKPVFFNKKPAYIVRWKYYRAKDDTTEPRENLLEDVPKLVRKYEKDHNVKWYETTVHYE